jgi:AcrR family transcriptional regulator
LLAALERAHDSRDPIQSLKSKLRAYIDFGRQLPNHYHFAFLVQRDRTGEAIRPHKAFDVLRQEVGRCVKQGPLRALDVETTSQALWATIHGVTSLLIVHPEFPWVGEDEVIDEVIEMAIRGLCAKATQTGDEEQPPS